MGEKIKTHKRRQMELKDLIIWQYRITDKSNNAY